MNALFVGWNRPVTGREARAQEHFSEFVSWLSDLQSKGTITSFDPVLLTAHGGDMNGFVLIKGEVDKLSGLTTSPEFTEHMTRGAMNMDRMGVIRAFTGDEIPRAMDRIKKYIP